ncbi:hypothetical protein M885DRAFT_558392 [Pelagophyceae sp. CCMP2097]|nr:hypothetical protein M885DRAFT_558392 [Pelagophyceae sp. CCMP2097]
MPGVFALWSKAPPLAASLPSSSRSKVVPSRFVSRLSLLSWGLIGGSLEQIRAAFEADVFIRGLPRFDISAVYDEIFTHKMRNHEMPESWEMWLNEIKAAPLLCAANKLRRKDPARWGPRFTKKKKKDAIRCLLDERDSLGEFLADTFKAHDFKERTELLIFYLWILTPNDLRARGHFPQIFAGFLSEATGPLTLESHQAASEYRVMLFRIEFLLDLDEHDARRQHLLRHHGSWNHPDRGGCLDKLRDCEDASEIAGFAEMEPPQLINVLRERTRLRMLGSNVHYKHLDNLQGTSSLAMLRSSHELGDAGEKLRNCALSYASQVESRTCVLVMLRDASGKPTALGQFDMAKAKWVQIREAGNKMPTDATRAALTGYTATIQAWRARTIA